MLLVAAVQDRLAIVFLIVAPVIRVHLFASGLFVPWRTGVAVCRASRLFFRCLGAISLATWKITKFRIPMSFLLNPSLVLTFGIPPPWDEIVQSTVVPEAGRVLSLCDRSDQVPNKVLDLLVAFVALEAVEQLKGRRSRN